MVRQAHHERLAPVWFGGVFIENSWCLLRWTQDRLFTLDTPLGGKGYGFFARLRMTPFDGLGVSGRKGGDKSFHPHPYLSPTYAKATGGKLKGRGVRILR